MIMRSVTRLNSGYKKIDPFADTETIATAPQCANRQRYKKIDPFADTETRDGATCALARVYATKKSIRLRILKRHQYHPDAPAQQSYKKIDPFADTETLIKHLLTLRFMLATKKSIRLRILKHKSLR